MDTGDMSPEATRDLSPVAVGGMPLVATTDRALWEPTGMSPVPQETCWVMLEMLLNTLGVRRGCEKSPKQVYRALLG